MLSFVAAVEAAVEVAAVGATVLGNSAGAKTAQLSPSSFPASGSPLVDREEADDDARAEEDDDFGCDACGATVDKQLKDGAGARGERSTSGSAESTVVPAPPPMPIAERSSPCWG